MSAYSTAAAKPIEWEVDDAAPTRLRWEKVEDSPSDLAATAVLRMAPPPKTFRTFPTPEDELRSDAETRVRILGPGPGVLARMRPGADSDAHQPIPLARRRDSVPTTSDVRAVSADRDSFPPMDDESGPAFIPALPPPPNTWVDTRVPPPPPSALAHAVIAAQPPVVVTRQRHGEISNLKLLLVGCWAFAVTFALIMSLAARHVNSLL